MTGTRPFFRPAHRILALALSLASAVAGAAALAQAPAAAPAAPAARASQAGKSAPTPARPAWGELTVEQQQALKPLAPSWNGMTEGHKRKWIALVANYRKLPPEEQGKLASRMTEWAALSPQQRAQARLNFGEAKTVPADERKAKWEAYQALSPEEKRKLAAGAAPKTPPTAAAVRPVPPQKLANVPRPTHEAKAPRIVAGPVHEHPAPAHPATPPAPAQAAPQAN